MIDETNRNFDFFTVPIHSKTRKKGDSRIIFLSDAHYYYFEGIGGYSSAERHSFMVDALLSEFRTDESFDAVVFLGDTVHNDHYLQEIRATYLKSNGSLDGFALSEKAITEKIREWRDTYMARLKNAGIPIFYANASHDCLSPDLFYDLFGYKNNYVLLAGDIAYFICDTFAGERNDRLQTFGSDIPDEFYKECTELLADSNIKEAYIACHYVNDCHNLRALIREKKVKGTLVGHSHYNEVLVFEDKPLLQTGHFSRANTVMLTWGLGFTPFAPIAEDAPYTTDEDGNPYKDYRKTGSPWQWRVMEHTDNDTETYLVFPEMEYGAFAYDEHGRHNAFSAFRQPFTEARPSFLGKDAPIDRSYRIFHR